MSECFGLAEWAQWFVILGPFFGFFVGVFCGWLAWGDN